MWNYTLCGITHHAEFCIMRSSASYGVPHNRVPYSMWNSALDFRTQLEIDAERRSNTPHQCGDMHQIPVDAEYWNTFSTSCGAPQCLEYKQNSTWYNWNSANCGEWRGDSPHSFFFYFNAFYMMRKCCSNTPHANFRKNIAENEWVCGNLRYGLVVLA